MKISDLHQKSNLMPQIEQTKSSQQSERIQNSYRKEEKPSFPDKVEISGQSRERQRIHELIQMAPEVRAEKVSAIKKLVQEGKYQIENEAIAEKMLRESILDLMK